MSPCEFRTCLCRNFGDSPCRCQNFAVHFAFSFQCRCSNFTVAVLPFVGISVPSRRRFRAVSPVGILPNRVSTNNRRMSMAG